MKTNFIKSLVRYLIEKEYFNLILPENRRLDFSDGSTSLIKDSQGTSVLLEIIDADALDTQQLAQSIKDGAALINKINGRNAMLLKLFLFDGQSEEEKIGIIRQGQADLAIERKFLKCMSVDIRERTVQKHFKVPNFDANVERSVKRFFSKGLDSIDTSYEDIQKIIVQRKKDYEIEIKTDKPWLTYGLIAVNILVWLLLTLMANRTGTSYDQLLTTFGAKVNSLIMQGEYWRLLSPMFLHSDIVHVTVNCYSLFALGTQVERVFGHKKFAVIYLVSGFMGCIASFAFSLNASVGASGAIFGLLGAMLFFVSKRPALMKSSYGANLVTMLVINVVYGFMNVRIDNHAHIGGLIGGFLTTGAVYTSKGKNGKEKGIKIASLLLIIAVLAGALYYGFTNNENRALAKISELQTLSSQERWEEAEKLAEDVLAMEPAEKRVRIEVLWSLTQAELYQKKYDEGIAHGTLLAEESPADGHFLLGRLYFETQQFEKARTELEKARDLGSPNREYIGRVLDSIDAAESQ